jgi:hypothetical protein
MRARRFASLVLGTALLIGACGSDSETAEAPAAGSVAEGTTADTGPASESDFPQFIAPTVGGSQLDFGSLEGQDTVLWFWAPW